jgi:hypothetical protein
MDLRTEALRSMIVHVEPHRRFIFARVLPQEKRIRAKLAHDAFGDLEWNAGEFPDLQGNALERDLLDR